MLGESQVFTVLVSVRLTEEESVLAALKRLCPDARLDVDPVPLDVMPLVEKKGRPIVQVSWTSFCWS